MLSDFDTSQFDSISLYPEELGLLVNNTLGSCLKDDLSKFRPILIQSSEQNKYKQMTLEEIRESPQLRPQASPRLWNLPEVFSKNQTGFTTNSLNEISIQNKLADIVRYNFSTGEQISAREILRTAWHRKVPIAYLPDVLNSDQASILNWPLNQNLDNHFVSRAVTEIEQVMQNLLAKIASALQQKKITVYLQSSQTPNMGLKLNDIEFDIKSACFWRAEFKTLKSPTKNIFSTFSLMSKDKSQLHFFRSYAVDIENNKLIVHPWQREWNLIKDQMSSLFQGDPVYDNEKLAFTCSNEGSSKAILNYLRTRQIPIEIEGKQAHISNSRSKTKILFENDARFKIQHVISSEEVFVERTGFTSTSQYFLSCLQTGICGFAQMEAKQLAYRSGSKREWDLKLLKHLGIFLYITGEVLELTFSNRWLDGSAANKSLSSQEILLCLSKKILSLLTFSTSHPLERESHLDELCSKSVLSLFERYIEILKESLSAEETYLTEDCEIVAEGLVSREFRLIREMLIYLAAESQGDIFRKSRSSFLEKIFDSKSYLLFKDKLTTDKDSTYIFENLDLQLGKQNLIASIETLQPLLLHQFEVLVNNKKLEQLDEDSFRVEFNIETKSSAENKPADFVDFGPSTRQINWFELNPTFFLKGESIDSDQILSLGSGGVIEYRGQLFLVPQKQLPSLKKLENFWSRLQKGKIGKKSAKKNSKIFELPKSQTLELLALRASGFKLNGDSRWQEVCDFYDQLGKSETPLFLSDDQLSILKPYQKRGIIWLKDLFNLKLGGLLADDMGLGKTLQTLFFFEDLRRQEKLGPSLIVVPSSLVYNWQSEAAKFASELAIEIFSAKQIETPSLIASRNLPGIVIVTYGLLMEHREYLSQYHWQNIVYDEAQNLKNITTRRSHAARSLNAEFKICLTGTPLENHFGEFYSILDLIVPGCLGALEDFRQIFVNTETILSEDLQNLKVKIRPLLLRRTKKEIIDQLPDKQESKVSLTFETKQKEIYKNIAVSYNERVKESLINQGEAQVQLQMLTALLRLRQVCSDPASLPNVKYDAVPPKLEALVESIEEITSSGESALVFTQFLQTLTHAETLLKKAKIPVYVLHGAIPVKKRQEILSGFQNNPQGAVLIMTLKTGGVGLNLTKASYVFHLEPWWNPAVENQATDRVYRLGQSKAVQVFRYIMHESLEEKIEQLKARKDQKFQSLFADEETFDLLSKKSTGLSKEDFEFLINS